MTSVNSPPYVLFKWEGWESRHLEIHNSYTPPNATPPKGYKRKRWLSNPSMAASSKQKQKGFTGSTWLPKRGKTRNFQLAVEPKIGGKRAPQIIHLFIGFGTMIFTIHFGGNTTPIFGNTQFKQSLRSTFLSDGCLDVWMFFFSFVTCLLKRTPNKSLTNTGTLMAGTWTLIQRMYFLFGT